MTRLETLGAAIAIAFLLAPLQAAAHEYDVGALNIGHPWAPPTPNGAVTAAGYLTVTNHGKTADRLLGGTSPLVRSIEPHTMSLAGGVMRMRLLPAGYDIPAGATLNLSPGGDHLMMVGLKRPFKAGDRIPATLRFAHAGKVEVYFAVQTDMPAGAAMSHTDKH